MLASLINFFQNVIIYQVIHLESSFACLAIKTFYKKMNYTWDQYRKFLPHNDFGAIGAIKSNSKIRPTALQQNEQFKTKKKQYNSWDQYLKSWTHSRVNWSQMYW